MSARGNAGIHAAPASAGSEGGSTSPAEAREAAVTREAAPVVVTRAEASDGPLSSQLRSLGVKVLLWPAIEVAPSSSAELDEAVARIHEFEWIVFTSRQAAPPVLERVHTQPPNLKVAAVGQGTAQVLKQRGWRVDLIPDDPNAGALVSAFAPFAQAGMRVLFPASSRALPTISKGLAQLGAVVTQVEAYRTEPSALNVTECREWIDRDEIGAVTFASPSAVIELERALGKEDFDRLLKSAAAVAIGATTARALTDLGCTPVMAESADLRGLANTAARLVQKKH